MDRLKKKITIEKNTIMNIICEKLENGDYNCILPENELPEYITLLENGQNGTFYFSNVLTPTDFLITFFFLLFLIIFIGKGIFNFVNRSIIFMKQKL